MRREAGLFRSAWRWFLVLSAWGALGAVALTNTFSRVSALHFVVGLSAVRVWFATFSLNPANRLLASILLLGAALLGLVTGAAIPAAMVVGLTSMVLMFGAVPQRATGPGPAGEEDPA